MTLPEFVNKYDGKFIDYDGYWGAQCVDLARQYIKEVLNFPQPPPVIGAADLWDNYLADYYVAVENTPTGVPVAGDIVIWNRKLGNGYGHVGIFLSGNVNSFVSFDQNYPLGTPCHKQDHNYSSVAGWLHPKENMSDALEACMQDREKFWKERDEALADLAECREECDTLSKQLEECRNNHDKEMADMMVKMELLAKTNEALREENEKLRKEIEALKSENPLDGYSGWELIKEGIKKLFGE